jgi:tRNA(fMet)-specific endonuclease VapC
MPPRKALLDTDILLSIMQQNPSVLSKAKVYIEEHGRFTFSVITRYEISRGLKAIGASKRAGAFDRFCSGSELLPLDEGIAARAADVYAELKVKGELIGDADILIAASALVNGLVIVTNNEAHFRRIRGLSVENWMTAHH